MLLHISVSKNNEELRRKNIMSLFEKQVNQYSEKFAQLYAQLGKKDVVSLYKKCGLTDVEAELRGNTKDFRVATLKIAMTLVPGIPSCTVYAAR